MTREQRIESIYEKVADKTLSFGCRFIVEGDDIGNYNLCVHIGDSSNFDFQYKELHYLGTYHFNPNKDKIKEIIGHPVMIGRCDLLIEKGPNYFDEWIEILDLWEKKSEPLENQSDKCIEFLFDNLNLGKQEK